jgi:type VI secretion system protein ImpE
MAQMYREALNCEALRAEVFAGRRTPLVLGEPPPWLGLLLEALRLTAEGNSAAAQPLRDQAFAAAPATAGTIDGQVFEWIADADVRLGPVVEAVVNGRYYWIPVQHIRRIGLEPPVDLRDLVWTPAQFTWANGGESVGVIPTRYPGSERAEDEAIRLARKTVWEEAGQDLYLGLGQRMLTTDGGEYPLMQVREIRLNVAEG